MKKLLLFFAASAMLVGCSISTYAPTFNLDAVRTSDNSVGTIDAGMSFYSNDAFEVTISAESRGFIVRIKNKSNAKILVNWNEGAYVDSSKEVHSISRDGVRNIYAMSYKVPSVIPAGAILNALVVAADRVDSQEWISFNPRAISKGSKMLLLLPITVGEKTVDYNFDLSVTNDPSAQVKYAENNRSLNLY